MRHVGCSYACHKLWIASVCFVWISPVTLFAQDVETLTKRVEALEQRIANMDGVPTQLQELQEAPSPRLFPLPSVFQKRKLESLELTNQLESVTAALAAVDADRDGLLDTEETTLGTSPNNADSDGDALLDGWEVHGVNGIDLRAMGASPLHKDIFVEMDFMKKASATRSLGPNALVLARIRQVFGLAPVSNPDGISGINIHLEIGNEVPLDSDLSPYQSEFFAIKGVHFDQTRAPVFHYMIWADSYDSSDSSGVAMGIPHSDFIVTLGRWGGGAGGTDDQKVGTFVHELGHTLGLQHGGSDGINYKPNHISVMNYSFQMRGVSFGSNKSFGYQSFSLPSLRENVLSEVTGLGGGSFLNGYKTIIAPSKEVNAAGSIDWNGNGIIDSAPQRVDLNKDAFVSDLLATPNQWSSLIYNGGAIGSRATLLEAMRTSEAVAEPFPYVELTEEMDQRMAP